MQPPENIATLSKPARLLPRMTLIAALVAIFTTTFFGNALPSLTPGGAVFSATAKQLSVASHYRGKTDGYRATDTGWKRQAFR